MKTLYESSQFTQLGRTVGIALNPLQAIDNVAIDVASESAEEGPPPDAEMIRSTGSTIFDAIADACNANKTKKDSKLDATLSSASPNKQSLLEQVMNCTLLSPGGEENFSFDEEDTYRTRENGDTFDEEEFDDPLAAEFDEDDEVSDK